LQSQQKRPRRKFIVRELLPAERGQQTLHFADLFAAVKKTESVPHFQARVLPQINKHRNQLNNK
jgi:hypothetical protein